jgi:hypothetical protein
VALGAELLLKFADGTAKATGGGMRLRAAKSAPKVKDPAAQGTLF